MHKLLKALFPFREKYAHLRAYWWHRLFVVLFFITISILPYFILTAYGNCMDKQWHYSSSDGASLGCNMESNIIMAFLGLLWSQLPFLPESIIVIFFFINSSVVFSILTTILATSYVLQVVYFKIMHYVILRV